MARDQNLSLLSPSAGSGSLGLDVFSSGAPTVEPRRATAPRATASTGGGLDDSLVAGIADAEGLSPTQRRVMTALLQQESGYGRNARTSVDGAQGAGQIIPDTFRRYAKPGEEIGNTQHNLAVMARIVKDLGTKTGDDPAKMATGYFSGEGNIGRDTPWKADRADGNGKRVSSYVSDVLGRLTGIPEAQAAPAERSQGAQPARAESQRDLSKAPAWADIAKNPEFQKLSPDQRRDAKGAYFDYWIAPNGGDDSLREQFMGMADPEPPGMLDKIKDAIPGKDQLIEGAKRAGDFALHMTDPTGIVRKGIEAISGRKPLMQDGMAVPERAGVDASRAPVKPEVRAAIERAYDAATPEQRIKLGQQEGFVGQIATELNQRYGLIDQEREQRGVPGMRSVVDDFDTRAEKRAERLVVRGDLDPAAAQERGRTGAAFGMTPGTEVAGNVEATEFDFDTNQLFKSQGLDNPLVRSVAKGGLGLLKGSAGVGEAMADFAFGPSKASGKVSQWARNQEEAIGQSGDFLSRNLEGAIASIANQLPLIIAGVATGGSAITLAGMAMNSFGQEYTDGKSRGLDPTNAASRAAMFAAFEVIGESFGLGGLIKQIGRAGKGIADPGELAKFFANNLKKEVPGELLTTTGQFLTDKVPAFGLNQQAGLEDYLKQVADTVVQTVMQGGIMAGGTTGVNRASQFLRQGDTTSDEAQFANALDRQVADSGWATSAQQAGLDAFARNVPGRELNIGAPPAPQAPTGLSVDGRLEPDTPAAPQPPVSGADPTAGTPPINPPTPNPIQQSVDSIVGELAQRAGVPLETVLPVGTNAEDPTDTAEIQKQILALEANNPPPTIAPDGTLEYANEAPQGTGLASGPDAVGEAGIAGGPAAQPQPAADAAGAEAGTEGDGQQAGTQPDAPVTQPADAPDFDSMFDEILDEEDPALSSPKTEKEARELRNGTQAPQAQQAEAQGPQAQPGAVEPVALPRTEKEARERREQQSHTSPGSVQNPPKNEQEPPVPEGMTRLYHGSATPGRTDGKAWFSTDRKYAENYREGAELQYVDYPTEKVNAALDPDGYGQTVERGFTWNGELDSAETGPRKILTSPKQEANAPQRQPLAGKAPPPQGPQVGVTPAGTEAQAGGAPAAGEPGVAPAYARRVFRGSGRKDKGSVYNGGSTPILGDAAYYALDEKTASKFGPNVETRDVSLRNPLVIDSDEKWRALTREAGWQLPNPQGRSDEETKRAVDALQKIVRDRGHDGVVIDFDPTYQRDILPDGRGVKTLRNVFSDPQVIVFDQPQEAAKPKTEKEAREQRANQEETNAGTAGEVASTDVRDGGDQQAGDARDPRGDREGAGGDVGAAAGGSAPGRGPDRTVQGAKSELAAALGTSPRKFFSDLIQAGGISMRLIKDITGEAGGKGSKGRGNILVPKLGPLFRNKGQELDELARRMAELGYLTEADIESELDNGGVNKLTEMIQAAIRGEPITKVFDETGQTESRFEKMARDQAEGEVRAEAERLGIDTAGKSLEQLSDEIEDALDAAANTEAALAATRDVEAVMDQFGIPEREFDAEKLIAQAAIINPDAVEAAAIRYDDELDFMRAIQEIVDGQGTRQANRGREGDRGSAAQEAGQRQGGAEGTRGGTQEEEGLLTQQTPEELRRLDEERKRREAEQAARDREADRKAEADAQRDTFELTGQGIQPGQDDMFGNSPSSSGLFGEQNATPAADSSADQVAEVSLDGERILTPTIDQVDDVADTIENLARGDGDFQVTHVFDPPTSADKVNLYDKAEVKKPKGNDWVKVNGEWMTPEQAKAELRKWKDNAAKQGNSGANANKVVLSLFDRTGVWAQPWADAGYQVFTFDIQNDPEFGDVTKFDTQFFVDTFNAFDGNDVYAILAACPCTDFTSAGNRWLAEKEGSEQMEASINLVKQTLATIEYFKPSVWAIENPVGTIERRTGLMPWRSAWDPFLFGDQYTKKTLLWGRFNGDMPVAPVFPSEGSKMWAQYGGKSLKTKNARSETPEGFAYAFFQANNAIDHPVMAIANKYDRLDRGVIEQAVNAGLTEREISSAIDDAYYLDLDDAAAEQALRDLIAERPAPAPEGLNADSMFDELLEEEAPAADQAPATEPPVETTQPKTEKQARERRTQPATRTRPDFSGKSVTLDVLVEDTGDTAKMTVPDAEEYFRRLEERESILRALVECLTK